MPVFCGESKFYVRIVLTLYDAEYVLAYLQKVLVGQSLLIIERHFCRLVDSTSLVELLRFCLFQSCGDPSGIGQSLVCYEVGSFHEGL
jgi:hypothetical protein